MFYSPRNRGNLDRFYRFRSRSISAAQAPRDSRHNGEERRQRDNRPEHHRRSSPKICGFRNLEPTSVLRGLLESQEIIAEPGERPKRGQSVSSVRSISGTVRTSAVEGILGRGNPQRTWRNRLSGAQGLQGVHQAEDQYPDRRLRHGGLDGDLTPLRTIDPAIERTGGLPGVHPGEVDEQPALVRVYAGVLSRKPRRT